MAYQQHSYRGKLASIELNANKEVFDGIITQSDIKATLNKYKSKFYIKRDSVILTSSKECVSIESQLISIADHIPPGDFLVVLPLDLNIYVALIESGNNYATVTNEKIIEFSALEEFVREHGFHHRVLFNGGELTSQVKLLNIAEIATDDNEQELELHLLDSIEAKEHTFYPKKEYTKQLLALVLVATLLVGYQSKDILLPEKQEVEEIINLTARADLGHQLDSLADVVKWSKPLFLHDIGTISVLQNNVVIKGELNQKTTNVKRLQELAKTRNGQLILHSQQWEIRGLKLNYKEQPEKPLPNLNKMPEVLLGLMEDEPGTIKIAAPRDYKTHYFKKTDEINQQFIGIDHSYIKKLSKKFKSAGYLASLNKAELSRNKNGLWNSAKYTINTIGTK